MYKKPKYTKPLSYSTINKYDSYQDKNPIQSPEIHIGAPLVFQSVGRVPPVINDIPNEKLEKVKYNQKTYKTVKDYGTF